MQKWILILLVALTGWTSHAADWLTNFKAAQQQAAKENKTILLDFTGSDWCPYCKNLKAKVLDSPEFAKFAQEKLVLVEVDFPRKKPLEAKQQKANDKLMDKYKVEIYPTLVLTDAKGKKQGEIAGYDDASAEKYLEKLNEIIAKKR